MRIRGGCASGNPMLARFHRDRRRLHLHPASGRLVRLRHDQRDLVLARERFESGNREFRSAEEDEAQGGAIVRRITTEAQRHEKELVIPVSRGEVRVGRRRRRLVAELLVLRGAGRRLLRDVGALGAFARLGRGAAHAVRGRRLRGRRRRMPHRRRRVLVVARHFFAAAGAQQQQDGGGNDRDAHRYG